MRSSARPWARLDPARVDVVFAGVVLAELEIQWSLSGTISAKDHVATAIASLLIVIPLARRRQSTPGALVLASAVLAVQVPIGGQLLSGSVNGEVAPMVVMAALSYSTGAWPDARRGRISAAIALALVFASGFLPGAGPITSGWADISSSLFYSTMLVIPGYFVGLFERRHRVRSEAFRELADQSSLDQETREAVAIAGERVRIGAELEDVIAHSISAMVVQAGAARMLLNTDPERARKSIHNVENTGRDALADLRRLLGMLHKDDDPRALSPQPGLGQLGSFVGSLGKEGFDCELCLEGPPLDLTPGVDLVAYRVIEAVITAAVPHTRQARVNVRYTPDILELHVSGQGMIPGLQQHLTPIRQRVALYDGTLDVPPSTGSRFSVRAQLPLGPIPVVRS